MKNEASKTASSSFGGKEPHIGKRFWREGENEDYIGMVKRNGCEGRMIRGNGC